MDFIGNEQHSPRRKTLFENREEALKKLLENMPLNFFEKHDYVVVGISFAGALFASQLAKAIKAPFDFLFTSPILAPNNPNCEIAMVSETQEIMMKDTLVNSFGISLDYIYGEAQRQYDEKILPLIYQYRKGKKLISLNNKRVLLVDEGVDSGLTAMACVKSAITLQAKTVHFAAPVAPFDVVEVMEEVTDGVFCLYKPKDFVDIGYYYKDYPRIEDSVIEEIFKQCVNEQEIIKES